MASRPPKAHPNRRAARTRVGSEPMGSPKRGRSAPQFTPLNIAYDRLLPLIRDLPDFKWPSPMRVGPDQRNRSLMCDYHRDHGNETNQFQSLKFLVEKLIRAGHLRRYMREPTRGVAAAPTTDRVIVDTEHASGPGQPSTLYWGNWPIASISPKSRGEKCSGRPRSEQG